MIAPFTRIFCLARKILDGVSKTFFIVDFFPFPFIIMFALSLKKDTSFVVFPLPFSSLVFLFPIFTVLV